MLFPVIVFFVTGLIFGSFGSVIIHRLHTKDRGIILGRSKCPKCANQLSARDLIPVLSFLINRHKCRYCKSKISFHYPILELVMGSSFALTAYLVGLSNPYILSYFLLLTFIFVVISFYDIFFQEIPDELSLPTILLTGLVGYFGVMHSGTSLLLGFSVPVLFFATLFLGSQGRWLGGGDVRIGAFMGFILGWPGILVGLFLAYLLGSIYSTVGLISGHLSRKSPIPFGPFLLIGTYIAMFWGQDLIAWYLKLI